MRRFTSLVAALAAAVLAFLSAPAVYAGGTLSLDEVAVGELDPAKATDFADSILMFNVYDTLVLSRQGGGGVVPHLAESWTSDGSSFTFTLRNDVAFHSGNRLSSADVVFSYDRMVALGQGFSHLFSGRVASVKALDNRRVRFTLSGTYAPFIAALTRLPIVDSATVKANLGSGDHGSMGDYGAGYLSSRAAGSGAYTITSHNPQELTVMQRNPSYFLGVPAAAPDTVRLRYGLEAATVRTLMARGEHDIASQWLPPEVVKALASRDDIQLFTESGGGGFYVKLNTTRAPLDDVHCRRALVHALDYATVLQLIAVTDTVSQGRAANSAVPNGMLGNDPSLPAFTQDMGKARAELAKCRHKPSDHTLEVSWIAEVPLEERFALLMQSNFSDLGFNAKIVRVPWALFTEQVSKPGTTPHISQLFVNAVTPDPDTLLYNMYHSSVAGTWQSPEYLSDAQVDQLLEQGRSTSDQDERDRIYRKLARRLIELAPTIYAYDRQSVFTARKAVKAEALTNPARTFSLDGMGFSFRLMEMQ